MDRGECAVCYTSVWVKPGTGQGARNCGNLAYSRYMGQRERKRIQVQEEIRAKAKPVHPLATGEVVYKSICYRTTSAIRFFLTNQIYQIINNVRW